MDIALLLLKHNSYFIQATISLHFSDFNKSRITSNSSIYLKKGIV